MFLRQILLKYFPEFPYWNREVVQGGVLKVGGLRNPKGICGGSFHGLYRGCFYRFSNLRLEPLESMESLCGRYETNPMVSVVVLEIYISPFCGIIGRVISPVTLNPVSQYPTSLNT